MHACIILVMLNIMHRSTRIISIKWRIKIKIRIKKLIINKKALISANIRSIRNSIVNELVAKSCDT